MSSRNVKKASIEIVDAMKCVLQAQTGMRSRRSCVSALKTPIHRFCKIARTTEKRIRKKRPTYEISRFLGVSPVARKKMGVVCSSERKFSACDKHLDWLELVKQGSIVASEALYKENKEMSEVCIKEVNTAIRTKSIERAGDYKTMLDSFETMRDWIHTTGYNLPDYVWVTPKSLREKTKRLFEKLSGKGIRSVADLGQLRREIQNW